MFELFQRHPRPWKVAYGSQQAWPYVADANGSLVVQPASTVGHRLEPDPIAEGICTLLVEAANSLLFRFERPAGHDCCISTGIHDCLTFGTGKLDESGFWEHPCEECARAHEAQFPEKGDCWPHTKQQLQEMGL